MVSIKTILSITVFAILLFSCGPSESEQKAKQQAFLDSVSKASEIATRDKIANEEIQKKANERKQQDENQRKNDGQILRRKIADLEAEVQVQNENLNDIKSPKFLRTRSEKESQMRAQLQIIQTLKLRLDDAVITLEKINAHLPYNLNSEIPTDTAAVITAGY